MAPGGQGGRPRQKLSFLGYVVLNLAAAAMLLLMYWVSTTLKVGQKPLEPYGLAVPLVFVWFCFVAASVFDAIYDRKADAGEKRAGRPRDSRSRERVSRVSGVERLSRD